MNVVRRQMAANPQTRPVDNVSFNGTICLLIKLYMYACARDRRNTGCAPAGDSLIPVLSSGERIQRVTPEDLEKLS